MNKVLITGGTGYIGGRLASAMLASGRDIRLGTRTLAQPLPIPLANCEWAQTDFSSRDSLVKACEGVQQIVHLAALNDGECARNPEAAFEVNVLGTLRLLDAARFAGVQRILYMSTAHVYGSPLVGHLTEETLPRPAHPYSITHRAAEDLILSGKTGMTGVVIRLANGFGAPTHPEVNCWMLLANDLCRQAVTTGKLVLKSSGMQQRNFVGLRDVTAAILHFLQLPPEQLGEGIFNVGGRRSMTVLEMTELIAARCETMLGSRPAIERASGNEASVPLQFDIGRAERVGFAPVDDYAGEIDGCLEFCRDHFGNR